MAVDTTVTFRKGGRMMSASAPKKIPQKVERLEARISPETKTLCQRAASLQGRSLTDFVVHSAVEAATRTIRESEFIELSRRDRLAFVEALLNAPEPNTRLQEAMQRHHQLVRPE
jgi:uncharacterized protein (DUF1778 family)